eukprot:CAMPEP_0167747118 /NCGR_PEP_ID=MMETSP0110_2-20121227/4103_1 /TAXON_ID=629695 /ORGANISM="Gymnochlora sp., Strain CCMP2014" /LENGTH=443 /DNA_ID=CAMNT_0007631983 /DNA_START=251 /DNA_END=1582 /DNA_ORIENTATION=+
MTIAQRTRLPVPRTTPMQVVCRTNGAMEFRLTSRKKLQLMEHLNKRSMWAKDASLEATQEQSLPPFRRALHRFGEVVKDLTLHDDDDEQIPPTTSSNAEQMQKAKRVIWLGIIGDIVLTVAKAIVGTLAKSPALLADSLHSLSDIIGHFVTLICVQISRRPSNQAFPYGFGKFETAGSLLVALIMIAAGVELIRESFSILSGGVGLLTQGSSPPLLLAAGITAFLAVVVKEVLFQMTMREAKKQGSPMLSTAAWHHRSDAMSSAVALVGIAGSIMGVKWADPVAGTLVAGLVLSIGLQIAWKSAKELMDVGVPEATLQRLQALVQEASDHAFESLDADSNGRISLEEWVDKYGSEDGFSSYDKDGNGYIDIREWNENKLKVKSLRARKMGPHMILDVDMEVPAGARFKEIQKAQDKMLKEIYNQNPRVTEIRFQLSSSASTFT